MQFVDEIRRRRGLMYASAVSMHLCNTVAICQTNCARNHTSAGFDKFLLGVESMGSGEWKSPCRGGRGRAPVRGLGDKVP